jgi:deoxycytidine triphosphate deaminase
LDKTFPNEPILKHLWNQKMNSPDWSKPLTDGIDLDDEVIFLAPNEFVIGHTEEFIGGRQNITTQIHARSSTGRSGLEVCRCAGKGDCYFYNRWALELQNNNPAWIPLIVGKRIAQVSFFYTDSGEQKYCENGSYQTTEDLEKLEQEWLTEKFEILPKLYKDGNRSVKVDIDS